MSDEESRPPTAEVRKELWVKYHAAQYQNLSFDDSLDDPDTTLSQPSLYQSALDVSEFSSCKVNGDRLLDGDPESFASALPNDSLSGTGSSLSPVKNPTLFFADGVRKIDFVLVWDLNSEVAKSAVSEEKRRLFEQNLEYEGLKLEYEKVESRALGFVKIHAPLEVLRRYSEILRLRLPMKELQKELLEKLGAANLEFSVQIPQLYDMTVKKNALYTEFKSWLSDCATNFMVDQEIFPPKSHKLTAEYSRDKEYLFNLDQADFFSPAIRARIVSFILRRKRYKEDTNDDFAFGIERMMNEYVYCAAYPLHDGDLRTPGSMRYTLYTHWASVRKSFIYQPLDYIKEYFGVKIGLYFAWLGFYTYMLIPAAIVGILCFTYSCITLSDNKPSQEICTGSVNATMCPICDHFCDYWDLSETCLHSKVTYLFDNPSTVFFAIFMSFWAALFLELWKRYSAEITHRWDLTGFDTQEEHPRPQYLARLTHIKKYHINVITNTMEPTVPFWKMKFPASMLSMSLILLLIFLALGAVMGVILYRMSVLAALSVYGKDDVISSNAILFTTATAASINLACILVFNRIYTSLAEYLTEMELHRTQTEFDDSLTLKHYLLAFVNYYSSIFYIAFFKGKFIGFPADYDRLFGYRQEECGPGGCLLELCIQLSIIMIGKQAMNTFLEITYPIVSKWWTSKRERTNICSSQDAGQYAKQWVKDFKLADWGPRALFPEYLEMVLQYGFVTIFVAAFPLAPFFALLNNIFETRLDAKKLLVYHRRPVGQRVKDIGIWYSILDSVSKLSIVTNGFIIAFTSEFIPRMVYKYSINPNRTLEGYIDFTLAYFDTDDFTAASKPRFEHSRNVTMCRYPDYREPPDAPVKYDKTAVFWQILVARLAFIVAFENVVALVMIFVRWLIPDVPRKLQDQIRRENFLTNEIVIKREMTRSRGQISSGDGTGWNPLSTEKELELVPPPSSANSVVRQRRSAPLHDVDESREVML